MFRSRCVQFPSRKKKGWFYGTHAHVKQGALMFSSAIAGISWTNLKDDHWLAAASWECSIVCALFAIITGAQHMLILDDHLHPDDPEKLQVFEHYLVSTENRPHWGRLLCWQGPMLLQTYSVVLFLVGLGAHVISPVVAKKAWDDDAKVSIDYSQSIKSLPRLISAPQRLALFSICAFLVVVAFGVFSQGTHNTFKSRDRV